MNLRKKIYFSKTLFEFQKPKNVNEMLRNQVMNFRGSNLLFINIKWIIEKNIRISEKWIEFLRNKDKK